MRPAALAHVAEALAASELSGVLPALLAGFQGELQCWPRGAASSTLIQALCCAAPAYALAAMRHNLTGASTVELLLDSLRQSLRKQVRLLSFL